MILPSPFINIALQNRLGQLVHLAVHHTQAFGREYLFVGALTQQASSLVAKNAEHFVFQLRELFQLDTRRLEMIELRGDINAPNLWRWRFEWVGASPLSPNCEVIISPVQQNQLLSLLNIAGESKLALTLSAAR